MLTKLNDWLADLLADTLSSMSCFWVITSMVIVVLFWQRPTTLVGWVTYFSTAVFQASALPVLGFVSNKQSAQLRALMQETHDTTMGELKLISESHDDLKVLVSQVHVKVGASEVEVTVTEGDG
jgi:hypothetical protein